MKSIIKTVLDGNWGDLKKDVESRTASMIKTRIEEKKLDVLSNLNKVSKEQMEDVVSISNDK